MSEAKIPAGWYPDPKDTTTTPRPERWWDGTGWTGSTRPGGSTEHPAGPVNTAGAAGPDGEDTAILDGAAIGGGPTVIEGEVLDNGTVRFPEPPSEPAPSAFGEFPVAPPKKPSLAKRLGKPVLVTAAVAGVLGLAIGSGVTYLAVDHHDRHSQDRAVAQQDANGKLPGHKRGQGNGGGNGQGNGGGQGSGGGNGPGNGQGSGGGNGFPGFPGLPGGKGKGNATEADDLVNGIALPVPSGWTGGTTMKGTAYLSIGSYQCPGSSGNSDGSATCSLGGVNTGQVEGTDPQAAAKQDIVAAAKESYGNIKSHQELKSEPVTVDGRSGYLIRWQVGAEQGNDGTVESVVFPSADGKSLISVRLGFDIADKAPAVSQMDSIISGIKDYTGPGAGTGGGTRT